MKRYAIFLIIFSLTLLPVRKVIAASSNEEPHYVLKNRAGKVIARAIYTPRPSYPLRARFQKEGGEGIFRFVIQRNGSVTSVAVMRSTGVKELDMAAANAFIHWRFTPPTQPIGVRVPVDFRMKSRITGGTILE